MLLALAVFVASLVTPAETDNLTYAQGVYTGTAYGFLTLAPLMVALGAAPYLGIVRRLVSSGRRPRRVSLAFSPLAVWPGWALLIGAISTDQASGWKTAAVALLLVCFQLAFAVWLRLPERAIDETYPAHSVGGAPAGT
jgi:hypothetical protein